MIRIVIAAIWICAVTAGSIYFAFRSTGETLEQETAPAFFGGLDYVRGGLVSVPLIRNGSVEGYLLSRLVYTVEPSIRAKLSVPAEALLTDQLYSFIYGNPQLDFSKRETLDLDLFRNSIRDSVNERIGEQLVHEVLVEQFDYLSKAEIRDNSMRRRFPPDRSETTQSVGTP